MELENWERKLKGINKAYNNTVCIHARFNKIPPANGSWVIFNALLDIANFRLLILFGVPVFCLLLC